MMSEFIERTRFQPLPFEYAKIEEAYYNFDGDKDAFCRAFVEADGEKKVYQARATEIDRLNGKILEMDRASKKDSEVYEKRIADLQAPPPVLYSGHKESGLIRIQCPSGLAGLDGRGGYTWTEKSREARHGLPA